MHSRRFYGLGAIVLGLVGIVFGDFARQWQPVPMDLPGRTLLAYAAAIFLLGAGLALQSARLTRRAALTLAIFYALWTLVLHGPTVAAGVGSIAAWLAPAEVIGMGVGAFMLYANTLAAESREIALRIARFLFGASAVVFGCSHFAYAQFTADMIPSWIPPQIFWAYATGAGHVAAGIAMLSGLQLRWALPLYVLMLASFVLCVHVPRIFATPAEHAEWIMLGVSMTMTGSAWIAWRLLVPARAAALPGHAAAAVNR